MKVPQSEKCPVCEGQGQQQLLSIDTALNGQLICDAGHQFSNKSQAEQVRAEMRGESQLDEGPQPPNQELFEPPSALMAPPKIAIEEAAKAPVPRPKSIAPAATAMSPTVVALMKQIQEGSIKKVPGGDVMMAIRLPEHCVDVIADLAKTRGVSVIDFVQERISYGAENGWFF